MISTVLVLRLVIGTWEGSSNSTSANMLNGVAKLVDAYGDSLKDDVFKEKLSKISVKEISRAAKNLKAGALGYAEALLLYYNARKTNNLLQWEQMYKAKKNNHQNNCNKRMIRYRGFTDLLRSGAAIFLNLEFTEELRNSQRVSSDGIDIAIEIKI